MNSLAERFTAALTALAGPGNFKYICAFSGGLDSTALLGLLAGVCPVDSIIAAHLDHNLRPSSGHEALLAQQAAEKLGILFVTKKAPILDLAQKRGKGLEEAARYGRYEFLKEVLNKYQGHYILTAHQGNDLAETILLKLFRGGGPAALAGIAPKAGLVLRPLLGFSRAELAGFVESQNLAFINDPSNQDRRFKRNHLRLSVWPELEKQNPKIREALARAADLAAAEEEFWETRVLTLAQNLTEPLPDGRIRIQAAGMAQLSLAEKRRLGAYLLRLIRLPVRGGGEAVPLAGVTGLINFAQKTWANGQGVDLPGGRRVEKQGLFLHIGPSSRFTTLSCP
jgi:tRNA(Ile)-lysidine synthase